jgi:hypothetical protein
MKQSSMLLIGKWGGLLVTVFFGCYFVVEGIPDFVKGSGIQLLLFFPLATFALFSFVLAWLRPLLGGKLMITAALLLSAYFMWHGYYTLAIAYGLPAIIFGICFRFSKSS